VPAADSLAVAVVVLVNEPLKETALLPLKLDHWLRLPPAPP